MKTRVITIKESVVKETRKTRQAADAAFTRAQKLASDEQKTVLMGLYNKLNATVDKLDEKKSTKSLRTLSSKALAYSLELATESSNLIMQAGTNEDKNLILQLNQKIQGQVLLVRNEISKLDEIKGKNKKGKNKQEEQDPEEEALKKFIEADRKNYEKIDSDEELDDNPGPSGLDLLPEFNNDKDAAMLLDDKFYTSAVISDKNEVENDEELRSNLSKELDKSYAQKIESYKAFTHRAKSNASDRKNLEEIEKNTLILKERLISYCRHLMRVVEENKNSKKIALLQEKIDRIKTIYLAGILEIEENLTDCKYQQSHFAYYTSQNINQAFDCSSREEALSKAENEYLRQGKLFTQAPHPSISSKPSPMTMTRLFSEGNTARWIPSEIILPTGIACMATVQSLENNVFKSEFIYTQDYITILNAEKRSGGWITSIPGPLNRKEAIDKIRTHYAANQQQNQILHINASGIPHQTYEAMILYLEHKKRRAPNPDTFKYEVVDGLKIDVKSEKFIKQLDEFGKAVKNDIGLFSEGKNNVLANSGKEEHKIEKKIFPKNS